MVCSQEFWYILSDLDIRLEQSENEDPARKNWFKESRLRHMRHMTNHIPFFSVGGYEPMALWSRRVAVSWQHGFNSRRMLKVSAATWPFCVAIMSRSVH